MKKLIYISSIAFLTGCAVATSNPNGPDGQSVHYIDGMTVNAAYNKAAEICPRGYRIIGNPEYKGMDYILTIQCGSSQPKREQAPKPAVSRAAPNPPAPAQSSAYAYGVRNLPEVRACNPSPDPKMTAKGAGMEMFTVSCANGDALSVRCDPDGCRTLQ